MNEGLGSFSFDVTRRILDSLYEIGPLNKTNLASKTGMNYTGCVRYIEMLRSLGWIAVSSGDVSITEIGTEVMKRLDLLSQGYANVIKQRGRVVLEHQDRPDELSDKVQPAIASAKSVGKLDDARTGLSGKSHRVMIVDDEAEVALTYESFLNSTGHYLAKAFSEPYAALREFASNPRQFDLVILDIRMPEINGIQLYQSLSAMNAGCKFIFVSSLDSAKEILSVLPNIRSEDVLKKPIKKEHFIRIINALFDI